MTFPDLLWTSQLVAAAAMTGIIWQVQLLTYPQFLNVAATGFATYHRAHTTRMGWVVAPLMLAELILALLTAVLFTSPSSLLALALVLALAASTAFIQVPLHRRLEEGRDPLTIRKLIRTNWIRTALWTIRTAFLFAILVSKSA